MEWYEIDLEILTIGGAAIFSFLVTFIVIFITLYQRRYNKYLKEKESLQREILQTQLETQEETFTQISEEIHDNVGQLLSTTRMLIGMAERSLKEVPDSLKTAQDTLGKAIGDLRMLSKTLNKEWLERFNLLHNLAAEVERINAAGHTRVTLNSSIDTLPLPSEKQVMLFRIVQEALQNSMKHAFSNAIVIDVGYTDAVKVIIQDDGKGFNPGEDSSQGVGIISMKHRTRLLGGSIEWTSRETPGTEVRIVIPVRENNHPGSQG